MDIIIGAIILFALLVSAVVVAPTVKMALDVAPYLYTNTRCAAKSALILTKKEYEALLATSSLKETFGLLETTGYRHVAEHGNAFGTQSGLLEEDLYGLYAWLEEAVPGEVRPIIAAIRARFEVNDLKEAASRLEERLPVEEFRHIANPNLRLKLNAVTDLTSFAAALEGTRYADAIAAEDIASELDRRYFEGVLEAIAACKDRKAAQPFREYWRRVIDLANARLALRRAMFGDRVAFIEGGSLTIDRLVVCTDRQHLLEALAENGYAVPADADGFRIEIVILKGTLEMALRIDAKYALRGGAIVRLIAQKEIEVRNLSLLLKLQSEGFSAERIGELMVI